MNFLAGQVLAFDKPYGITSFALVNKVRWLLTQRMGGKKLRWATLVRWTPWPQA